MKEMWWLICVCVCACRRMCACMSIWGRERKQGAGQVTNFSMQRVVQVWGGEWKEEEFSRQHTTRMLKNKQWGWILLHSSECDVCWLLKSKANEALYLIQWWLVCISTIRFELNNVQIWFEITTNEYWATKFQRRQSLWVAGDNTSRLYIYFCQHLWCGDRKKWHHLSKPKLELLVGLRQKCKMNGVNVHERTLIVSQPAPAKLTLVELDSRKLTK